MTARKIDVNIVKFKIVRKTSQYNPRIKWYAETYREDGTQISSHGYKTQRDARDSIVMDSNHRGHPFPIGERVTQTHYVEIKEDTPCRN
jgi:hypothetical protein